MTDNEVPTDEQIRTQMEVLIKTVDLNVMSIAQFIAALSDKLGCRHADLHTKKKFIKENITEILDEMSARDKKLFTQPDGSHFGECPICLLPLPLDPRKWILNSCCCKRLCIGCDHANKIREIQLRQQQKCAFCREPLRGTDEEIEKDQKKRIKANDPIALLQMGKKCCREEDYDGAFEYFTKAAELGDMDGHYELSCLYHQEKGVERNMEKLVHHLEEAAIGGHPLARYNLGVHEGSIDRAVKHYIIAAKLGDDEALDAVKEGYKRGYASKEDFATALRGHQAAVDETKSEQRTAAYASQMYL
jgi:tetratricopeptide (TPR) repeat protein